MTAQFSVHPPLTGPAPEHTPPALHPQRAGRRSHLWGETLEEVHPVFAGTGMYHQRDILEHSVDFAQPVQEPDPGSRRLAASLFVDARLRRRVWASSCTLEITTEFAGGSNRAPKNIGQYLNGAGAATGGSRQGRGHLRKLPAAPVETTVQGKAI